MDGGAASVDRRIDVGDRLVSVKNFPGGEYVLDNCTHEEVGQLKLEMNDEQRNQNPVKTNTLETGYKKTGSKNNPVIRWSTVWIAYKNKPDIRPFSSGIKGIPISGFQCAAKWYY